MSEHINRGVAAGVEASWHSEQPLAENLVSLVLRSNSFLGGNGVAWSLKNMHLTFSQKGNWKEVLNALITKQVWGCYFSIYPGDFEVCFWQVLLK